MSTTSAQKNRPTQSVGQLQARDLVAGDIIAKRSDTARYIGIRTATMGQVCHAILYTIGKLGVNKAVDATTAKGVASERFHRKLDAVSDAEVFRHTTATAEQCARAYQWAELQEQLHKPYDDKSAARVGKPTKYTSVGRLIIMADDAEAALDPEGEDASFMCAELVFRAWEIAGAPLIDKPAHLLAPTIMLEQNYGIICNFNWSFS